MVSKYFRFLTLFIFTLSAVSVMAATRAVNGVMIDQAPVLEVTNQRHGYEEIAYNLTNTTDKPREVSIEIEGRSSGYALSLESLTRQVTVPPNSTLRANLFKPYLELRSPRLLINVQGTVVSADDIGLRAPPYQGVQYGSPYNGKICVLLSRSIPGNAIKFYRAGDKSNKITYNYPSIPLKSWSDNWLAFSGFDSIMLTPLDWEELSARTRKAIMDYVALGGTLTFCGGERPTSYKMILSKELSAQYHGFGMILYAPEAPEKYSHDTWKKLDSIWGKTYNTMRTGINSFHEHNPVGNKFEVVKKDKAPAFQLFFLMLIFAVIIGPLNLYILHRKKKRIWILWTTPVIALAFSLLVVGYSFIAEGWSSKVKIASFTLLNEKTQTASTLGVIGYYCPLASGSLTFDDSVEIQPYSSSSSHGNSYSVDWSNGQKLSGDWIKPRITSVITLRKSEQRRERIKIVSVGDNNIRIINGLGSELENIVLRLPNGRSYRSSSAIKPGATATLLKLDTKGSPLPRWLRNDVFGKDWLSSKLNPTGRTCFPRGTYMAKLADPAFLKTGIEPDELKTYCHVFGILAEGGVK